MNHDRIKLVVKGLSISKIKSGAYALILADTTDSRYIPVVIGPAEAQSIAIFMERVTPPRPVTHELFSAFAHAFGITLREVLIYKFEDGIFYSQLTFSDGQQSIRIDSRTSDAIAIALRQDAPIYATADVVNATSFVMNENDVDIKADSDRTPSDEDDIDTNDESAVRNDVPFEKMSDEELLRQLDIAISNEEYEIAKHIKEIINSRNL